MFSQSTFWVVAQFLLSNLVGPKDLPDALCKTPRRYAGGYEVDMSRCSSSTWTGAGCRGHFHSMAPGLPNGLAIYFDELYTYLRGNKNLQIPPKWRGVIPNRLRETPWCIPVILKASDIQIYAFRNIQTSDIEKHRVSDYIPTSFFGKIFVLKKKNFGSVIQNYSNPWLTRDYPVINPWQPVIWGENTGFPEQTQGFPNP